MTLLPGRDLGSELRQASVPLGSVPCCAETLCFCFTSWALPIVPTAQPSHAVQSWPERTATFGKSMRDRPHAPHQPSSVSLRIAGHQSSPAGRAVGAPIIKLATRSTAFPLFSPARRARESYLSRFSPAPRWGPSVRASFPFIPSPPLSVCLASDAAPSEGNSAGAAGCLRRGRTLAPVRFRVVFAHRSRGSHLQQSRPRPPGHTSFVAQTSLGDPPPLRLGGLEAVT